MQIKKIHIIWFSILCFFSGNAMAGKQFEFRFINKSHYKIHITEGMYHCFKDHEKVIRRSYNANQTVSFDRETYDGINYNCSVRRNNSIDWFVTLYDGYYLALCSVHINWYARKSLVGIDHAVRTERHIHYTIDKNTYYPLCKSKVVSLFGDEQNYFMPYYAVGHIIFVTIHNP